VTDTTFLRGSLWKSIWYEYSQTVLARTSGDGGLDKKQWVVDCLNGLVCKGSLECVTSCRARRLLVCYIATFMTTTCFDLINSSWNRHFYVILELLLFLVH
jgi:hypothetical protein